jgi:hypothetical protein
MLCSKLSAMRWEKRERDMVSIVGDGAQEVMRTDGYETVTWKKREEIW